jgi:hypothetical protein
MFEFTLKVTLTAKHLGAVGRLLMLAAVMLI